MELIVSRNEGRIGTIIMNHAAKRNALSEALIDEIVRTLEQFRQDKVRTVVLRAPSGSRVWSAGHDISELPNEGGDPLGWGDLLRILVRALQEFPAPVIGLIEGGVWGGACEVAMACDFLVATPEATFAITPAKLGIPYSLSGLMALMHAVPLPVAKEMLFSAQPLSAERALALGLVNYIKSPAEIEGFVYALADTISRNAPLSIAAMKEELRLLADTHALSTALFERIQGLRRLVHDSRDYREGLSAWRERRPPEFSGA